MNLEIRSADTEDAGGLRYVVLRRGRGNALDRAMLHDLADAFASDSAVPTVLCAEGRSFCTGLDLDVSLSLDRGRMREQMEAFQRALLAVFTYPAPVAAAIEGHALAGGALLALCADVRIMASGAARFGIHGVHLGVVYPDVAVEIARFQLGPARAEHALYEGRIGSDAVAVERGWVDELADAGSVGRRAGEWVGDHAGPAFTATKRILRSAVADRIARSGPEGVERWLDHWFAEETRRKIVAARGGQGG